MSTFDRLPTRTIWLQRSFRLPRLWSNTQLRCLGPLMTGDVVNVSGWDDRDKQGARYRDYFPRAASYSVSNYQGERGLADANEMTDIVIDLAAPLPEDLERRFDVVFNHTTLEHVFEVRQAFANLCALTRDIVIVVVPFAQELHFNDSYGDYWRLTPMALREMFRENGLKVVFESANRERNAGVYLMAVGSRHGDRWRERLPAWEPVDRLGSWIGITAIGRLRSLGRRLLALGHGQNNGDDRE